MAKIFVGMSGGVDSSTSAALLQKEGHDVTGVFIKVWEPDFSLDSARDKHACTWEEERRDAMRVSAHLGIPFKTYDFADIYKKEIVDSMIDSYKRGDTPNPDVLCNRYIKFGAFLKKAREEGADYVATGHYAQVVERGKGKGEGEKRKEERMFELHKGVDMEKDQTYFLWQLTQEELAHTFFPVGGLTKREVRVRAEKFGLPVAEKKDSQGLCFIGKLDMKEFLKHFVDAKPGDVLNLEGEKIGEHDGAVFYTLGQRHGYRTEARTPDQAPMYVVAKDVDANTITVASNPLEDTTTDHSSITVKNLNWISHTPRVGEKFEGRLRYRQKLFSCTVTAVDDDAMTVSLSEPQPFVPRGQSLVLYRGDVCVGGGIITG